MLYCCFLICTHYKVLLNYKSVTHLLEVVPALFLYSFSRDSSHTKMLVLCTLVLFDLLNNEQISKLRLVSTLLEMCIFSM